MGRLLKYKCSKCNYEVLTSGKKDYGMMAVTKSYICNDCKIITDVTIGEFGKVISKNKLSVDS
jgi:DNA-directed RNA polymerase subunit RPC12/RpoP